MTHIRAFLLFAFCILFSSAACAQKYSAQALGNDTLTFEEAASASSPDRAGYISSVAGLDFQFQQNRAAIQVTQIGRPKDQPIELELAGANRAPQLSAEGQLPGIVNYFPSGDPRTWRTNLRTWSALRYRGVYPGIDLVYYGNRSALEYDFIVAPQADPRRIVVHIGHAQQVRIAGDGGLNVNGMGESLSFSKPLIYQLAPDGTRQLVAGRYVRRGADRIGFDIPDWDRSRALIIDPVLTWSSFVGQASDTYYAAAIDSSGNLYMAGRGTGGIVIEKLSSTGATVLYRDVLTSTPAYSAQIEDMRVDSSGNVCVVGYSGIDFPTTSNAFLGSVTSGTHAIVAVLNSTGTALTYATYLAGTTNASDQANGVAIDSLNKIYVTGYTASTTFPTTPGVIQTKNATGYQSGFVAKIDPTKSGSASLVYSSYLSGPTTQAAENAIAVDATGNAYVTGSGGSDFPITKGAFAYDGQGLGQGGVYVTKLNPTATALVYSAYLGVGQGAGIAVDGSGGAYLAGTVGVEDFPTTTGAYQTLHPIGFASELNATGTTLVYSTYLSGPLGVTYPTVPTGIAIASGCSTACDAYITGYTGENDLPLTNPIQDFNASWVNGATGNDAFVTVLNATGTAAVYSTYIGGAADDSTAYTAHSPAIAVDASGDAFVVGETSSPNFPVTLTATPQRDTFALKIGAAAAATGIVYPTSLSFSTVQPVGVASTPSVVNLRNMGSSPMTITSITPSPSDYSETNTCGSSLGAGSECAITVTFNPTSAASRPGTLTIVQGGNNSPNVVTLAGTGVAQPYVTLTPPSLTFADQSVDTASPSQTVTVSNSAKTSLTLSSPPFTTTANFSQTNNCPSSLAQDATCTVNIAFLPTQNGPTTGQLSVASNSSYLATTTVNLAGNGVVGTPTLTLSSAGLVFSPQVMGTNSAAQTVTVTNTGDIPVNIFGVSVTGTASTDFTETGCVQLLSPGYPCSIRVNFDPTAPGSRTATVSLADSAQTGMQSFTLSGTGVTPSATLSFDPPSMQFADLAVGGTSGNALLQITNTGNTTVTINHIYTTGDFRLNTDGCTTLRVAATCNIDVQFTPTAIGARAGTLVIEDNATVSSQTATLSGNGIGAALGAITTPDNIDFGTQAQGTTSPNLLNVTLENTGNLAFNATNVAITGTDANDFQISSQGCLDVVVIPGRSCQVSLTFTPTATGSRSASLTFTNLAGTQTATLTGTGVAATFALGLTPTSVTFQPQQRGVSSPAQTAYLINQGTAPVTLASVVSGTTDYSVSGCSTGTVILANSYCQLYITLDPTVTTTDNSTVTIKSNATGSPQTMTLTGSGATTLPAVQLSPAGLAFNTQVVATSSNLSVEVTNNSSTTVTGIKFATTGSNAADFTITSNSCSTTLASETSCGFYVSFKPSAIGERTAAISITDSAGTQSVALAGYAVNSSTSAQLVTSALEFPNETIGFSSLYQPITFENTGNTAFTIQSIVLGGTNKGDFALTVGCPITPAVFNPFLSCNSEVTFTPTATGTRTATVTITYTGAAGSPVTATLTGNGVSGAQSLEVGPTSLVFPPQVESVASPLTPTVLLTNTGTSPVTISSIALGGSNPGDFAISNGCPSPLSQGPISNTCLVYVTFTPTAVGARSATLTVTDSAPGSPTKITLTGTGVAPSETLTVSPTTLAFNPQVSGTTSGQQTITVTNTGNSPFTFTNVTISKNYALSNDCSGQLPAGNSCSIGVTFTPSGTGSETGTVTITDSVKGSPQTVALSGTGILASQGIELSQTAVVFDPQTVSTLSPPQTVYYYNQGNTTVTINTVTQADAEFQLTGSSCVAGTLVSPQTACSFRITFKPSAAGARSSTLQITDTLSGSTARTVSLSGTGITGNVPGVNLTPASLTFTTQAEGTVSAAQNINLTNNGLGNLTFTSIAITGADPGDFSQTNNCVSPIAAGFSCNIAVTFSPTAIGARSASVSVTDNATGSPQSVTLTGTGKAGALPAVTLTPTSLSFPNVALNTKSSKSVTVENSGAAPLSFTSISIAGTVSPDFTQNNTCTGSIAVGKTCTVTVNFTPSTFEDQTASVTLVDNAAISTQTIPITGNGAEPAVFVSPSSLTFSGQAPGTTSPAQTITVENYGNVTLTLKSVTAIGPFLISANTCGTSLAPGLTCSISVEFKPTVAGGANGEVVIMDNAGDSPQMLSLSGTGT